MDRSMVEPKYDIDPLLRWIRAARIIAADRGLEEVNEVALRAAASALAEAKEHVSKSLKMSFVSPKGESSTVSAVPVLSNFAAAITEHHALPDPSDWVVRLVTSHPVLMSKIATSIGTKSSSESQ